MKKLLLMLAVSGCACLAQADTMSFITVLSSPVGSFNKLETADPSLPAYGKAVNFCTRVGNGGVVELKGTQTAVLGRTDVTGGGMYLSSGTTLGKTDQGKFSLNNITLKKGGNITGGRLFANTVAVNNAASGKAVALHGETLTIAGAKTKKLDVANGNSYIEPKDGQESPSMVWSNEYQSDSACSGGSACAKQYLLKSKGSSSGDWELHPIDPPAEVEYEYYWSWTNSDSPNYNAGAAGLACVASCVSMLDYSSIDLTTQPIPLTRTANSFSPTCNASNVGKKCMTGGTQKNGVTGGSVYAGVAGAPYCPEYTCVRKIKQ